jgi:hypothetical protein
MAVVKIYAGDFRVTCGLHGDEFWAVASGFRLRPREVRSVTLDELAAVLAGAAA